MSNALRKIFTLITAIIGTAVLSISPVQAQVVQPATTSGPSSVTVYIQNNQFQPQNVTVPAGYTVLWINKDTNPHAIVGNFPDAPWGRYDSGILVKEQATSHSFIMPGTFSYADGLNPAITGTVTVGGATVTPVTTVPVSNTTTTVVPVSTAPVVTTNNQGTVTELPKTGIPLLAVAPISLIPVSLLLLMKRNPQKHTTLEDVWQMRQMQKD